MDINIDECDINRIYNNLKIYFLYCQIIKKYFDIKTNLNIINIKVIYIKFKYKYLRVSWHKNINDYKQHNHSNGFVIVWLLVHAMHKYIIIF